MSVRKNVTGDLWSEANRLAAWVGRVRMTWASRRAEFLHRMRAGETPIQAATREPLSTAEIDLGKPVPKTEPMETVLFHYTEDGGRWEVTADEWWSVIDDGVIP